MSYEHIKANLNLFAVLRNFEDLPKYDPEAFELIKQTDEIIEFWILGNPSAYLVFKNGECSYFENYSKSGSIKLFFITPYHFNMMLDNKAYPIPLKGLLKINFLQNEFTKISKRLEYYLKPDDDLLKDNKYIEINTLFTLNTALFAAQILSVYDPKGKILASQIPDGIIQIQISSNGPVSHLIIKDGVFKAVKGCVKSPSASMFIEDIKVANDLLNNKIDPFTAIASGDVQIKGQLPMIDTLSLIFDLIPNYLS